MYHAGLCKAAKAYLEIFRPFRKDQGAFAMRQDTKHFSSLHLLQDLHVPMESREAQDGPKEGILWVKFRLPAQ